jgi:hypothetical protein
MEERLAPTPVRSKPGNIVTEWCKTCHAPSGMSEFEWDFDRGVITNRRTGIRFSFVGPSAI